MNHSFQVARVWLKGVLLTTLGTLLLALSTAMFILPYKLVTGGLSGLAIIANTYLPWSEETWIAVLTVLTYLLGLIFLDRAFAIKTLLSTLVYPLGVALFSRLVSPDVLDGFFYIPGNEYAQIGMLLAALFGGLLTGAGCALTFLGGGSTGGVDIIAFIICKFILRIKSSTMIFVLDAAIILMGMMVTKNIVITLLGILCAFTMALMIDKVFLGQSRALVAHIISTQHESIEREIIERLDRTTTVIPAHGGYTGQPYHMLMVTFTMNQYASLLDIIKRNDKRAFVTIQPVHEINGEGFTEQ